MPIAATSLFVLDIPVWEKVVRTLVVYFSLLLMLRVAGKRELGQLNAFDFVVLLLLSNTLQNAIIGSDNSLLGGIVGAITLLLTNAIVVRSLYRHRWLDHVLEGEPEDLIRQGRILQHNLARNLITKGELEAGARKQGIRSLSEVESCRLEVGGTLTFGLKEPTAADSRHHEVMARLERLEQQLARLAPPGQPG